MLRAMKIMPIAFAVSLLFGFCQAAQRSIYPDPTQAQSDLTAALKIAATGHRRVIVDFGGDWCTDCQVLDIYLHDRINKPLLEASYLLVHVNVGHLDQNLDIAEKLQIPLKKGVPAMAVIDSNGALLYSQHTGEFESMRHMKSSSVTQFLMRWKIGADKNENRHGNAKSASTAG